MLQPASPQMLDSPIEQFFFIEREPKQSIDWGGDGTYKGHEPACIAFLSALPMTLGRWTRGISV